MYIITLLYKCCIYLCCYINLAYIRFPAGDIATFCSDDVKRGRSLYLANKEYPASIRPTPEGDECQCIIRTSHPQVPDWQLCVPAVFCRCVPLQASVRVVELIAVCCFGWRATVSLTSRVIHNLIQPMFPLSGNRVHAD